MDNGDQFIIFPALEKRNENGDLYIEEYNEINLEINPETDIQIELTFFDEKPSENNKKSQ